MPNQKNKLVTEQGNSLMENISSFGENYFEDNNSSNGNSGNEGRDSYGAGIQVNPSQIANNGEFSTEFGQVAGSVPLYAGGNNAKIQGNWITAVRKNNDGDIQDVMLTNGNVVDVVTAMEMADKKEILGVNTGATRDGKKTLRSNPDGDSSNNLDNLPTF